MKEKRIISGDVLTGKKISEEGYFGFYDTQICNTRREYIRVFRLASSLIS